MSATIGMADAEAALVGALMLLPSTSAVPILTRLAESDLVEPQHRLVVQAVRKVLADGADRAEPVLVVGELRREGFEGSLLADRTAEVYLFDLLSAVLVPASAGHYLRVVLEHAARRRAVEAVERVAQVAKQGALDHVAEVATTELRAVVEAFERVQAAAVGR